MRGVLTSQAVFHRRQVACRAHGYFALFVCLVGVAAGCKVLLLWRKKIPFFWKWFIKHLVLVACNVLLGLELLSAERWHRREGAGFDWSRGAREKSLCSVCACLPWLRGGEASAEVETHRELVSTCSKEVKPSFPLNLTSDAWFSIVPTWEVHWKRGTQSGLGGPLSKREENYLELVVRPPNPTRASLERRNLNE